MKNYCVICWDQSPDGAFNRDIVGVCNELKHPVCAKHAHYCVEDGHETDPLPTEDDDPESTEHLRETYGTGGWQ